MALNGLEYYFPVIHPLISRLDTGLPVPIWGYAGKLVRSVYYLVLWSLALIGGAWLGRRHGLLAPAIILLTILALAGPFLPFVTFCPHSYYVFGTLPFLSIASAAGIRSIADRVGERRR